MTSRKRVRGAVLALLSLPLLLALFEAVGFYFQNRNNGALVSSGEKRAYLLHVPESYDATKPTPLVISLHGGASWPVQQRDISAWNDLADHHGFIVVYPSSLDLGEIKGWRVIRPGAGLVKDVRFIADLIDELGETYNIDPTRIYANGFSNGAGMTYVLSCALSERLAATGMVAAAHFLPWSWCTNQRPVPMISFHGTADPMIPYEGGKTWLGPGSLPDVSAWAANWAQRNRCGAHAVESAVAADVSRRTYTDCADDAAVVHFTIQGGGHTWPGGKPLPAWILGPTSHGVDATEQMWAFFQQHRLRPDAGTSNSVRESLPRLAPSAVVAVLVEETVR